jgi:uncharacterized caspase-like protein
MTNFRIGFSILFLLLSVFVYSQESSRDLTLTRVSTPAALPIYTGSHALIIGINKYPNLPKESQLRFAVNDAEGMRNTLVDFYGYPADNVVLLTNEKATLGGIVQALRNLSNRNSVRPDDRILIYFSGHGQTVRSPDGSDRGFLIPHDAKVNLQNANDMAAYEATCLPMQEVWNLLDPSPAKHVAVIADACFSGLLVKPRSLFEENPLAAYLTMPARQAISAGGRGQKTWETEARRHGIFTYNLLAELQRRAKEKQLVFSMLELFSSIAGKVIAESRQRQTPQLNQFFTEGQMLFFASGDKKAPDSPPLGGAVSSTDPDPTAQIAKLVVKSNPEGAKVYVDGVDIGDAPLTKEYEISKNQRIKVRLELEGYEPREKTVELKPKRETKVDERLKKIKEPEKPKPATLKVITSPAGATVTLDGEVLGTTPLERKVEIPANKSASLKLDLDGYETAERRVDLKVGRETKLTVTLVRQPERPKSATLDVVTVPPGAEISIDGVVQGKSPLRFNRETTTPISVSVRASLPGYEIAEQTATLDPSVPASLSITLRKTGGTDPVGPEVLRLTPRSIINFSGTARNVQFSPYGSKVAVTGQDGVVSLYDAQSGTKISEIREPVNAFVRLSSDWKSLIHIYLNMRGAQGTITVLVQDVDDPKSAKVYSASMGAAQQLNYANAQGGQLVVCGIAPNGRAAICVMDLATGKSDSFEIGGRLQGGVVSPDGDTVAVFRDAISATQDTNLFILRGSSREDNQQVRLLDSNIGQKIFFAQSGDVVAVNAGRRASGGLQTQRGLRVYEVRDGRMRFSSTRHVAVGFMAGGTRLLGWSEAQGGSLELFDAVAGKSLGVLKSARPWLSDDGRHIAIPVRGAIEILDIASLK